MAFSETCNVSLKVVAPTTPKVEFKVVAPTTPKVELNVVAPLIAAVPLTSKLAVGALAIPIF